MGPVLPDLTEWRQEVPVILTAPADQEVVVTISVAVPPERLQLLTQSITFPPYSTGPLVRLVDLSLHRHQQRHQRSPGEAPP